MYEAREGIYNPPADYDARQLYEQGRSIVEEERQRQAYHDTVVDAAFGANQAHSSTTPLKIQAWGCAFALIYIPVIFFGAYMIAMAHNSAALRGLGVFALLLGLVVFAPALFWRMRGAPSGFLGFVNSLLLWFGFTALASGVTLWVMGLGG